jgi:hypothetical protein
MTLIIYDFSILIIRFLSSNYLMEENIHILV